MMTDISLTPDHFTMLWASLPDEKIAEFESALAVIAAGVEAGAIRNAALTDARAVLSHFVEEAWRQHVTLPFFNDWKAKDNHPKAVVDYSIVLRPRTLRDVLAAGQKRSKYANDVKGINAPAIDAMHTFIDEVLPLAAVVEGLKDKVVKGRIAK